MPIITDVQDDEALLASGIPDPIPEELADRVARLALLMTLKENQRRGMLSVDRMSRPWLERSRQERVAMRAGAIRVVQALILLGLIEAP